MSRNLNGTTDDLSSSVSPITQFPFSISGWFNPDVLSGSADKCLISGHDDPSVNLAYYVGLKWDASWRATLYMFDGSFKEISAGTGGGTPSTGSWQHFAVVANSSTSYSIFYNGANKATQTTALTMTLSNLNRVRLGERSYDNTLGFDGLLAYMATWDGVALSDSQVLELYTKGPLLVGSANAYWPLTSNSSPEPDDVGSNDLTVNGATFSSSNPSITLSSQVLFAASVF